MTSKVQRVDRPYPAAAAPEPTDPADSPAGGTAAASTTDPADALAAHAAAHDLVVVRDPAMERRLAALWDPPAPSERGRKARFTREDVVAAGVAVAQEAGLAELSMRRVAARLGVGAMSLYTYVPGRVELVDLMIDAAFAELDLSAAGTPWRVALARYAREHKAMYDRHRWILETAMGRLPLAPHVLDAQENGLRTLVAAGLPEVRVAEVLGLIDTFVWGMASVAATEDAERRRTGLGFVEYWSAQSSFWEDHFDVQRYPAMTRVYLAGGFDGNSDAFEAALDRLLDGVEHAIAVAEGDGTR